MLTSGCKKYFARKRNITVIFQDVGKTKNIDYDYKARTPTQINSTFNLIDQRYCKTLEGGSIHLKIVY